MTDAREGTRSQEHVIEIDASPDAVWEAISTAEGVTRWYVTKADIEPKLGGTYSISWGEGMDGVSDITAFEPGKHFQIQHRPMPGQEMPTGPMIEEFFLERDGDRTVLRLVTSGIPDTEDWDWFYEGTKRGWRIFLISLRHYLEHHAGTAREQFVEMVTLPGSCEEGWEAVIGESGLDLAGALDGATAGDRYAATTSFGASIEGELLLLDPPYRLLGTVEGLNDGLLSATLEQMGPTNILYFMISTFGLEPGTVDAIRAEWGAWLKGLFPASEPPVEAFENMLADSETAGAAGGGDA